MKAWRIGLLGLVALLGCQSKINTPLQITNKALAPRLGSASQPNGPTPVAITNMPDRFQAPADAQCGYVDHQDCYYNAKDNNVGAMNEQATASILVAGPGVPNAPMAPPVITPPVPPPLPPVVTPPATPPAQATGDLVKIASEGDSVILPAGLTVVFGVPNGTAQAGATYGCPTGIAIADMFDPPLITTTSTTMVVGVAAFGGVDPAYCYLKSLYLQTGTNQIVVNGQPLPIVVAAGSSSSPTTTPITPGSFTFTTTINPAVVQPPSIPIVVNCSGNVVNGAVAVNCNQ